MSPKKRRKNPLRFAFKSAQENVKRGTGIWHDRQGKITDGQHTYSFHQGNRHLYLVAEDPDFPGGRNFASAMLYDVGKEKKVFQPVIPGEESLEGRMVRPYNLHVFHSGPHLPEHQRPPEGYRNKNILPLFLRYFQEQGVKSVVVMPLNEELYRYYKSLGFKKWKERLFESRSKTAYPVIQSWQWHMKLNLR